MFPPTLHRRPILEQSKTSKTNPPHIFFNLHDLKAILQFAIDSTPHKATMMASKKRKQSSDPEDDIVMMHGEYGGAPSNQASSTNRTIVVASRKRLADPVAEKYNKDMASLRQQALELWNEQFHTALVQAEAAMNQSQAIGTPDTPTIAEQEYGDRVFWMTANYSSVLSRINKIYPVRDAGVVREVMSTGSEDTFALGLLDRSDDDVEKEYYYPPTIVR